MAENLKPVEEVSFPVGDAIMKDLMGKVAEMSSVVKENTVQVKKAGELAAKLPVLEKQLEVLQDWVRRLEDGNKGVSKHVDQCVTQLGVKVDALGVNVDTSGKMAAMPAEEMTALRKDLSGAEYDLRQLRDHLSEHAQLFEKPLRKEVHYRHFLSWPIWVVGAMAVATLFAFRGWMEASDRASDNAQASLKLRYLWLLPDSGVHGAVKAAEDSWIADPDQFTKLVEAQEEEVVQYFNESKAQKHLDSVKAARRK